LILWLLFLCFLFLTIFKSRKRFLERVPHHSLRLHDYKVKTINGKKKPIEDIVRSGTTKLKTWFNAVRARAAV
jgi:hypothetical protein